MRFVVAPELVVFLHFCTECVQNESLEASVWMRIGSEEEIFSSSSSLFLALRLFEENTNRNRKCSRTVSCGHKKSNSF